MVLKTVTLVFLPEEIEQFLVIDVAYHIGLVSSAPATPSPTIHALSSISVIRAEAQSNQISVSTAMI